MSIAIFQWMLGSFIMILHPYHVSHTEVNYNPGQKTVEISVRILTEDLEKAVNKDCKCKVELLKASDRSITEQKIKGYLDRKLEIVIDGNPVELSMIGFENESENTWSYLEAKDIHGLKKLEISNKILYELHKEQINMIQVKANDKESNNKLEYPNTRFSALF